MASLCITVQLYLAQRTPNMECMILHETLSQPSSILSCMCVTNKGPSESCVGSIVIVSHEPPLSLFPELKSMHIHKAVIL